MPLPERVTLATGVDPDELVLKVAQVRVAAEAEEAEAAPAEGEAAEAGEGGATTTPSRPPSGAIQVLTPVSSTLMGGER